MAGDWIKMRVDLTDDPAVVRVAADLDISEDEVVGKLHRLWSWADRHTSNGEAPGITAAWVDRYVGKPGFAGSLKMVGWLAVETSGIAFPNFDRHNGQTAKKRGEATIRQRVSRNLCDKSVTEVSPEKRREEKRREKTKTENLPATAGPPPVAEKKIEPAQEPKTKKPREPNPLFDAVAEVSGRDPSTAGGQIGTASAKLAKANPPYTPAEVREFGERFWELCPWAADDNRPRPTPTEIPSHIGLLRAKPPPEQRPPPRGPHFGRETIEEKLKRIEAEESKAEEGNRRAGHHY